MEKVSVRGVIHAINPTETVSPKFKKREFVVTVAENPQYPQPILFQMTQDKCNVLDGYKVGQTVEVFYNLRGREHNGTNGKRFYNTLECWRVVNLAAEHDHANKGAWEQDDLPY